MTLRDYVVVLKRGWMAVVICALVGALIGWGLAAMQPRQYSASSGLYVSIADDGDPSSVYQMGEYMRSQMVTYSEFAHMPVVLDPAVNEIDADVTSEELADMISVEIPSESYVMEITATASDPNITAQASQAVANNLSRTVEDLAPQFDNRPIVTLQPIREAATPKEPVQVPRGLWAGAGLLVGVVLGLLLAFALSALRQNPAPRRDRSQH